MTFFGSLGTAVLGINAQATAIGHISDNVANAGTNGYRQVSTRFSDLVNTKVLGASPVMDSNRNMGITASADFNNRRNGTVLQNSNRTSFAIAGGGYIPVARATSVDPTTKQPLTFDDTTYYTRLGDFRQDNSNRLVNSAGYYLQAAAVGGTTPGDFIVDTTAIAATATATVDYIINLPAGAQTGRQISNGIGIIDADGNEQSFQVSWQKTATDTWEMTFNTANGTPASFGPVTVTFANGLLGTMVSADPNLTVTGAGAATATFSTDFGAGAQAVTVNLGNFNGAFSASNTSGLTQFGTADNNVSNFNIRQNGLLAGEFSSVSFDEDGQIIYNYTNGRSAVGGQILLANFPEPDRLDRVDGTAFIGNRFAGNVVYGAPGDPNGNTGVGSLINSAVEQSNVDVAEQMSKLIVAQQAYSLNGQVITATDEMLSRLIDMKR
ncbi:flagellar hook-basal body complex protein [Ferrovibrio sp.]|uniref:flagellar hook-basal body complex protein n=1 Tax=Ferrovibrio sp. TaxID=1917215 RepID=UPI00311EA034